MRTLRARARLLPCGTGCLDSAVER
jgi:hypothetical protein